jgi:hypothetical protein
MDRLIPLIDFVLEQAKLKNSTYELAHLSMDYARFLRQPLQLWMFVPCKLVDGVWVGLTKTPEEFENHLRNSRDGGWWQEYYEYRDMYEAAKDRCLFEDVEYTPAKLPSHSSIVRICKDLNNINYPRFWGGVTVESLIPYNLILTETAKKIINA